MIRVKAGWAVHGKRPGAFDEYAVLAASSWPCPPAGFRKIIDLHQPGNPPAGKQAGVGGLPWVTFGAASAPEHMLWVIRQDWAGAADGASRPIVETRLVCARLDELTVGPLSLRALYAAALHLLESWEPPDTTAGDAVTLDVPAADLGHLADVVGRFGLERLATVAAAVIDKPVAVLSGEMPELLDRIDLLDAVAALLPAGAKSWLRPGTWTEPAMKNMLLRLAFTARRREDQLRFPLSGEPDPSTNPNGREYADELVRLVTGRGLETVIKHLAGLTALTARDSAKILDGLLELDLGARLVKDARSGAVDLDRVRTFDQHGGFATLSAEQRLVLLEGCLGEARAEDLDLVARNWTQDLTERLYPAVVRLAVRALRRAPNDLSGLLSFAGMVGVRKRLLTDLLDRENGAPEAPGEVVALVRRGPADPMLLRMVAEDSGLSSRAVLEELVSNVDDAGRLVGQLADARGGAAPELLRAVRVVLTDAGEATGMDVAELERCFPGVTVGLLRICRHHWPDRLRRILPATVEWLCYNLDNGVPGKDRPAWAEQLRTAELSDYDRGRADVLRAELGDRQSRLPLTVRRGPAGDLDARTSGFVEAARASGPARQHRVIDWVATADLWSLGEPGVILDLLWELGQDQTGRFVRELTIAELVADGAKRVRGLASTAEFRRWGTVFDRHPNLLPELWQRRLHELNPATPIDVVASVCAQATAAGMPVDAVFLRIQREWTITEVREFIYLLGLALYNDRQVGPRWDELTRAFAGLAVASLLRPRGRVNLDVAARFLGDVRYARAIGDMLLEAVKPDVPKDLWEPRTGGGFFRRIIPGGQDGERREQSHEHR